MSSSSSSSSSATSTAFGIHMDNAFFEKTQLHRDFVALCSAGCIDLAMDLYERNTEEFLFYLINNAVYEAAKCNHVNVVQWLTSLPVFEAEGDWVSLFACSAAGNALSVLEWMLSEKTAMVDTRACFEKALSRAGMQGYGVGLSWLMCQNRSWGNLREAFNLQDCMFLRFLEERIVKHDNLGFHRFLYFAIHKFGSASAYVNWRHLWYFAIRYGNLEIAQFITHTKGLVVSSQDIREGFILMSIEELDDHLVEPMSAYLGALNASIPVHVNVDINVNVM